MPETTNITDPKKIWDSALELLWQKSRFTSYFYQSVQFAVDDSIPTLGLTSSDYRPLIIYNPDFVISKNKEELVGLLVHELLHIVFDHDHRSSVHTAKGQDMYMQNLCQDMVVNSYILNPDTRFFSGAKKNTEIILPIAAPVIPKAFYQETGNDDPTWEEVFQWITNRGPGQLIEFINEVRKHLTHEKREHVPVPYETIEKAKQEDSFEILEEKNALVFKNPNGVASHAGVHFMDMESNRRQLKASLKRIIRFSDSITDSHNDRIYQDIRRMITTPLSIDMSFRKKIRSIVDKTAPSNEWKYSASKFSRRYADSGIYSPGRVFREKERIIVAVDVSASMTITPREIEAAFGAIEGLLDRYRVHLVCIDETLFVPRRDGTRNSNSDDPEKPFIYKKDDWKIIKTGSSGTTIFAPMFNSFLKNRHEMVIVITDGYIYDLEQLRPYPKTIWLVSGNRTEPFRPHFGHVEKIKITGK